LFQLLANVNCQTPDLFKSYSKMSVPNIDRNVPGSATLTVTVLLVRFMLLIPPSIMLSISW